MPEKQKKPGKLYLCPTPIGNLNDITLRTLDILRKVDLVAAEDTRRTRKLFSRYSISTPLMSYREENRMKAGQQIIKRLKEGENVALVSDAGMPGISDPGEHLVGLCLDESLDVEALPGPNAALTALVASGLPTGKFVFEGFLPRKRGERIRRLEGLTNEKRTLLFYESPARISDTLRDMNETLGNRRIALARELTKKFEQILRGSVSEVLSAVEKQAPRGELVLVVEGAKEREKSKDIEGSTLEEALRRVNSLRAKGFPLKEAVEVVAGETGLSKRMLYNAGVRRGQVLQ
ncbi:MAG: 16S rRNA (cytidine(1402)-2'-O)-methyltransferase [Actinomycetota bacterium]|nr:16S rRNA (cytidine(1402)-2'-O)-methyltransferase [Actinomycetota bacterium]